MARLLTATEYSAQLSLGLSLRDQNRLADSAAYWAEVNGWGYSEIKKPKGYKGKRPPPRLTGRFYPEDLSLALADVRDKVVVGHRD